MVEDQKFQPLRDFLPSRAGLHLVDFQNVFLGATEKYALREPRDLCRDVPADAILFSADPEDDGKSYLFTRCEDTGLFFLPVQELSDALDGQALAFVDGHTHISTFFAEIMGGGGNLVRMALPHLVYWRKKRFRTRLTLDHRMVLGRRDGKTAQTRLINFSTGGVGFLTDIGDLQPGELVLMIMDLAACGPWEVTGVIVRTEPNLDAQHRVYAAARFQLLRTQQIELERIYRCLGGFGPSRSPELEEP
ncbi:MAG: PilZ domain-containing protein, partial [Acidithiobacillus sp.]